MKNIIIAIIFCATYQIGMAQNYVPSIENNTTLHYICKLHGQTRTLTLTTEMRYVGAKLRNERREKQYQNDAGSG